MMLGKAVPRRIKMHNKTPETPKASPRLLPDSSKKPHQLRRTRQQ